MAIQLVLKVVMALNAKLIMNVTTQELALDTDAKILVPEPVATRHIVKLLVTIQSAHVIVD
jgi:hypothetical protein